MFFDRDFGSSKFQFYLNFKSHIECKADIFFIHGQIGANLLHLARVAMLDCSQHKKLDVSRAKAELDMAKNHLHNSIRFVLVWHAYLFHNYFWISELNQFVICLFLFPVEIVLSFYNAVFLRVISVPMPCGQVEFDVIHTNAQSYHLQHLDWVDKERIKHVYLVLK